MGEKPLLQAAQGNGQTPPQRARAANPANSRARATSKECWAGEEQFGGSISAKGIQTPPGWMGKAKVLIRLYISSSGSVLGAGLARTQIRGTLNLSTTWSLFQCNALNICVLQHILGSSHPAPNRTSAIHTLSKMLQALGSHTPTHQVRNCYTCPTNKGLKHGEVKDWGH
ncbi:hypothetical protein DV515_00007619, partial [Chloebia gouldiae]